MVVTAKYLLSALGAVTRIALGLMLKAGGRRGALALHVERSNLCITEERIGEHSVLPKTHV